MNQKKLETLLILTAMAGFLAWNYPILNYLSLPLPGIFKLFILFSSWIAIVFLTRIILQKMSSEK